MNKLKVSKYTLLTEDSEYIYILNTYSGQRLILDIIYLTAINNVLDNPNDSEYKESVQIMYDKGFLIDFKIDELERVLHKYDQGRHLEKDVSLLITPSTKCNMNCFYCYQNRKDTNKLSKIDSNAIVKFVETKLKSGGNINITWFGGEPILQLDFIKDLTANLKKLAKRKNGNYRASMVTNGYFLTNDVISTLVNNYISAIQITFDGDSISHDKIRRHKNEDDSNRNNSFNTIINNIHKTNRQIQITLRVNVSQLNKGMISNLINELSEANLETKINNIYFHPIFNYKVNNDGKTYNPDKNIHLTMEEYSKLEANWIKETLEKGFRVKFHLDSDYTGCSAVKTNSFTIDSNGEIKKCTNEIGEKDTACYSLRDKKYENKSQLEKWDNYRPEDNLYCSGCSFLPTCYSNCPHRNMITDIDRKEKCPSFKFNWKETFPEILKREIVI